MTIKLLLTALLLQPARSSLIESISAILTGPIEAQPTHSPLRCPTYSNLAVQQSTNSSLTFSYDAR